MEEALRLGKHAFVMEDDLVICSDFHKRMAILDTFVETHEWDVLWMGGTFHVGDGPNGVYWHKKDMGRDAEQTDHPNVMRTYGAFSTHAYIVNVKSLEKILASLDKWLHLSMGIDWLFIQLEPQLFTYSFVPGIIKQYDNPSDIGNGITYFSNFKKLGPYWWQDRMEDFDPTTFDWKEAAR